MIGLILYYDPEKEVNMIAEHQPITLQLTLNNKGFSVSLNYQKSFYLSLKLTSTDEKSNQEHAHQKR